MAKGRGREVEKSGMEERMWRVGWGRGAEREGVVRKRWRRGRRERRGEGWSEVGGLRSGFGEGGEEIGEASWRDEGEGR